MTHGDWTASSVESPKSERLCAMRRKIAHVKVVDVILHGFRAVPPNWDTALFPLYDVFTGLLCAMRRAFQVSAPSGHYRRWHYIVARRGVQITAPWPHLLSNVPVPLCDVVLVVSASFSPSCWFLKAKIVVYRNATSITDANFAYVALGLLFVVFIRRRRRIIFETLDVQRRNWARNLSALQEDLSRCEFIAESLNLKFICNLLLS